MLNTLELELTAILDEQPIQWHRLRDLFHFNDTLLSYRFNRYTINLDKVFNEKPEYRAILSELILSEWRNKKHQLVKQVLSCIKTPLFLEGEDLSKETRDCLIWGVYDYVSVHHWESKNDAPYVESMTLLRQLIGAQRFKTWASDLLMTAVSRHKAGWVRALIGLSVDVNQPFVVKVSQGVSQRVSHTRVPLHQAYVNNDRQIFEILLQAGADVTVEIDQGKTLFELCLEHRLDRFKHGLSQKAEQQASYIALLIQYGANIECRSGFRKLTPLLKAASAGDIELVKLLIKAGADLDAKDKDGQGIFQCGHADVTDFIDALSEKQLADYKAVKEQRRTDLEAQRSKRSSQHHDEGVAGPSNVLPSSSPSEESEDTLSALESLVLAVITQKQDQSSPKKTVTAYNLPDFDLNGNMFDLTKFIADEDRKAALREFIINNIGKYDFERFFNWLLRKRNDKTNPVFDGLDDDSLQRLCHTLSQFNDGEAVVSKCKEYLTHFFTIGDCIYLLLDTKLYTNPIGSVHTYILNHTRPVEEAGEAVEKVVRAFPKDLQAFVASQLFLKLLSDLYDVYVGAYKDMKEKVQIALRGCLELGANPNQEVCIVREQATASSSHTQSEPFVTTALALASEYHDLELLALLLAKMPEKLPEGFSLWPLLEKRLQERQFRNRSWSPFTYFSAEEDCHLTQIKMLCDKYPALATEFSNSHDPITPCQWARNHKDGLLVEYFESIVGKEKFAKVAAKEQLTVLRPAPQKSRVSETSSSSSTVSSKVASSASQGRTSETEPLLSEYATKDTEAPSADTQSQADPLAEAERSARETEELRQIIFGDIREEGDEVAEDSTVDSASAFSALSFPAVPTERLGGETSAVNGTEDTSNPPSPLQQLSLLAAPPTEKPGSAPSIRRSERTMEYAK